MTEYLGSPLIKSDRLAYKIVDGKPELLGEFSVEVALDSAGNRRYYLNGLLHNPVGPALITRNGYREWYIKGKQIHPVWLETRNLID